MRSIPAFLFILLLAAGCASTKTWSYSPEPRQSTKPIADLSVAVLPFQDGRENVNKNRLMLYLIPLVPFGTANFETPEGVQQHVTSGLWQFRPDEDFAQAVAEEIENARVFRETFVSNRASDGDLVLMGEIASTKYEGKMISYGLSVYGPLLWFIGLPAATVSNQLELRLRLARTPDDPPLWTHTIIGEVGGTSWLYAMKPDFQYDELLKQGMQEAIPSLAKAVRELRVAPPQ